MGQIREAASDSLALHDPIWNQIREEAEAIASAEPQLAGFIYETVLSHESLEAVVAHRIAARLDHGGINGAHIRHAFDDAVAADPKLREIIRVDLGAVFERDPACSRYIEPVLYFKGFHAIQTHRLAHWLWNAGRQDFALYLQSRASEVFQVDIHPAVQMGRGIFIDHATGLVVGMTAEIGDEVSILQGVTLGGTGKEDGDRHPKIRKGVLIGAGAKILGNIEIGCCSRIAAGSVVLKPVPAHVTVAGVPARVVGQAGCEEPSIMMDQTLSEELSSNGS
ncbi:MAG: serine O-acetyltransferase [Hyphomicrobiales bacterium]|nr:MAG: serine O-acetyltransferase [Hyphomicrobiales bacterium]